MMEKRGPKMKLVTKSILRRFKRQGDTNGMNAEDVKVPVKFFDACSNWTWYPIEYDEESRTFFGWVTGFESELGYFCLDELEGVRNKLGLPLERDLNWNSETTLADVMSGKEH